MPQVVFEFEVFLRATNPTPKRPLANRAKADGSGAGTGAGLEENVPVPEPVNGPGAGYAWLLVTTAVAKSGMSDERLNEAFSEVVPMNCAKADAITSWPRLPAVALALKLAPLDPT